MIVLDIAWHHVADKSSIVCWDTMGDVSIALHRIPNCTVTKVYFTNDYYVGDEDGYLNQIYRVFVHFATFDSQKFLETVEWIRVHFDLEITTHAQQQ